MNGLIRWAEPWSALYNDSPLVQTTLLAGHLGGIVLGGGLAIATDRATLRVGRGGGNARVEHVRELAHLHSPVLVALSVTFATGLGMVAADLEAYLGSAAFWIKMGLLVLLLANGARLRRAGSAPDAHDGGWHRLRAAAVSSLVLWLALIGAGTWLSNMS